MRPRSPQSWFFVVAAGFSLLALGAFSQAQPAGDPAPPSEAVWPPSSVFSPESAPSTPPTSGGSTQGPTQGLSWHILQNPNGPHSIFLVDPIRQVLAVYQVDSSSGAIKLMSVRNVSWDLRIENYNSSKPAPEEIRAMQP